jgi:hypothetical protein
MIRNLLIMASSGLVLFNKQFLNSIEQPRMVGSLITAIMEFATQTTSMNVSYIELTNVSITIVVNEATNIFCALFFDRYDGPIFGKMLCKAILEAFVQDYAYSSEMAHFGGRNLKDFHSFQHKIQSIILMTTKQALIRLELHIFVEKSFIVYKYEVIHTGREIEDGITVGELSIFANNQELIDLCDSLCKHKLSFLNYYYLFNYFYLF